MKKGSINGDAGQKLDPCEFCIRSKAKKLSFPAPVNSLGGGRYYMSIIDDYTRKAWVYILKEKSESFSVFKNWCKEVETKKSCSLKCLRTDNGLEYLSKEFDVFCKENGIKRHRTVPANPQQNGIAERFNRTLLERVRCMLLSSGLEKKFWGEAASTAAHLINKCPSSSIGGDIPDERWYGGQADYSRLRPFGCNAFAHTRDSKLDPRALRCVMLGYQMGVKGYRLWCLESGNHKVIVSRDVVFLEEQMPCHKSDQFSSEVSVLASDGLEVEPDEASSDDDAASDGVRHGSQTGSGQQSEDLTDYLLARDRTRRVGRKLPARYADSEMYFLL